MSMSEWISANRLAKMKNITPQAVRKWCREGLFGGDAKKVAGVWIIHVSPFLAIPKRMAGRPPGSKNKPKNSKT